MTEKIAVRSFTSGKPAGGVILLHGLGANAENVASSLNYLPKKIRKEISYIVPQAPSRAITLNGGIVMPAWFDILGLGKAQPQEDLEGLEQSRQIVLKSVEELCANGVNHDKIVVGGFSQGGALAIYCLMQTSKKFIGCFSLSGYLPRGKAIPDNDGTPVLLTHGTDDDVIPVEEVRPMPTILSQAGFKVQWHELPGLAHSINQKTIDILAEWLKKTFQI